MRNPRLHKKTIVYITILFVSVASGFYSNLMADGEQSVGTPGAILSDTGEKSRITRYLGEFQINVKAAPDVLAAVAELEESQAIMEQVQAENGIKSFWQWRNRGF